MNSFPAAKAPAQHGLHEDQDVKVRKRVLDLVKSLAEEEEQKARRGFVALFLFLSF